MGLERAGRFQSAERAEPTDLSISRFLIFFQLVERTRAR
jgi:hypothetical protein